MSFVEFLILFLLERAIEVESPSTPLAPLAKGFEAEKMATVSSPNLMFWSYAWRASWLNDLDIYIFIYIYFIYIYLYIYLYIYIYIYMWFVWYEYIYIVLIYWMNMYVLNIFSANSLVGSMAWCFLTAQSQLKRKILLERYALNSVLGGGFTYFFCSPLFGEDSQFDYCNIFQMGWNHQLVYHQHETPTIGQRWRFTNCFFRWLYCEVLFTR